MYKKRIYVSIILILIIELNKENYKYWKVQMKNIIIYLMIYIYMLMNAYKIKTNN